MIIKDLNKKLLETIVLFFVIFFPRNNPEFFPLEEIGYSLLWRLPALILILLLLESSPALRPKKDILALAAALPALLLAGFLVSLAASITGFLPPEIIKPGNISGWIAVILLSLSIGALEEAFFRVYLPERIRQSLPQKNGKTNRTIAGAFIGSTLVFSLCHVYEGPWGITNAILASAVLSIVYIKSSSFPGIALAHGLYNIFVFLIATLN